LYAGVGRSTLTGNVANKLGEFSGLKKKAQTRARRPGSRNDSSVCGKTIEFPILILFPQQMDHKFDEGNWKYASHNTF